MQRISHGRHLTDGVEQAVVVDEIFVAHDSCIHAGGVEMTRIGKTLVAQHIAAGHLHERGFHPTAIWGAIAAAACAPPRCR